MFEEDHIYGYLRKYFFGCFWSEVYDLIEFIANNNLGYFDNNKFKDECNALLEKELSAYRFVGNLITPITSKIEASEIEKALQTPLKPVNLHIQTALKLLSDRKEPDYRNSIKESISAVESICNKITGDNNDTLGKAIKKIKTKIPLHGALENAFSSLYGYTSTAEGIRHALMDEPDLHLEDAIFMLVSCSAFINYLMSKATREKISLK